MPRLTAVNLDSVESVSTGVLVKRLGRLSDDRMRQICEAREVAVDCANCRRALFGVGLLGDGAVG